MEKISITDPKFKQDEYWTSRLKKMKEDVEFTKTLSKEESKEMMTYLDINLYEIMKLAIENGQYLKPYDDYEKVSRVCRVLIPLSREEIKKVFQIETYSIRSVGLYTLLEGMMMTKSFRDKSGYDETGVHRNFKLDQVSSEIRESYDFRLAIPAMGGLFIPKKTNFTSWIDTRNQIEYFDIML